MPDLKAAAAAIEAFLHALGRDSAREPELVGTPERVAEMFARDLCSGYETDPAALLAGEALAAGSHAAHPAHPDAGSSEVVVVRDLAVATTCPHHLMPATGVATVAFAPRGRLVGIGALGRALDALSRRLTLQEEIGAGMARAMFDGLSPAWAGCRLVMTHTCMTARGQRRHGARVETVSILPVSERPVAYHVLLSPNPGSP